MSLGLLISTLFLICQYVLCSHCGLRSWQTHLRGTTEARTTVLMSKEESLVHTLTLLPQPEPPRWLQVSSCLLHARPHCAPLFLLLPQSLDGSQGKCGGHRPRVSLASPAPYAATFVALNFPYTQQ
jgi:hypothetical protein